MQILLTGQVKFELLEFLRQVVVILDGELFDEGADEVLLAAGDDEDGRDVVVGVDEVGVLANDAACYLEQLLA